MLRKQNSLLTPSFAASTLELQTMLARCFLITASLHFMLMRRMLGHEEALLQFGCAWDLCLCCAEPVFGDLGSRSGCLLVPLG
jgi:hypothetical protein